MHKYLITLIFTFFPSLCLAENADFILNNVLLHPLSLLSLVIFVIAYTLVVCEDVIHLRKSKPVIVAAGLIWVLVAILAKKEGQFEIAEHALKHYLLEYAELLLFLLVAMTYINAMEERRVFQTLKSVLVARRLSYRELFWMTGVLSFFISAIADNLTTALLMCAVVIACGKKSPKFIAISCVNIVVSANAGGAFSPFGDITTLMVWQKGVLPFQAFFNIFVPSLVNYLVPAAIMHFAVPTGTPEAEKQRTKMQYGGTQIIFLFLLTIATAISFHNILGLPPVAGMMLGLGYLQFYGFYLRMYEKKHTKQKEHFDIFKKIERAEWDTLLFFYGVIMCVGGLSTLGYLEVMSHTLYNDFGQSLPAIHQQTPANVTVGILSAIVDNIPVMFAVLTMYPEMSNGQWLLVTLCTGVGGSLLSVGSAAGVALMGQARGHYTFTSHLKWTWAIALGYFASIICHIWWNHKLF